MLVVEPDTVTVKSYDEDYGTQWTVVCGHCFRTFNRTTPNAPRVRGRCETCGAWNEWQTNLADLGQRGWYPA
jgi:hypothetical protein